MALVNLLIRAACAPLSSCTTTLPPISSVPTAAARPVDPAFAGFAFEGTAFYQFLKNKDASTNEFSVNLINSIAGRTGVRPYIRIGGTSFDTVKYDPTLQKPLNIGSRKGVGHPTNITVGPGYFDAYKVLGGNARYIPSIPFADLNLTNAEAYAKAAVQAAQIGNVYALEIGNEPNRYSSDGNRPSGWGPKAYIPQWIKYTDSVLKAVGLSTSAPEVQALAVAYSDGTIGGWSVQDIFPAGLEQYAGQFKTVSDHYYQFTASGPSQIQPLLMNHTYMVEQTSGFVPQINYLQNHDPNIVYLLGEVGSALSSGGDGNYDVLSIFAGALWQADFFLYMMSLGVGRINYQSGLGYGYEMWTPRPINGLNPAVRAPFYGQVFAADFIAPPLNLASTDDSEEPVAAQASPAVKVSNINLHSDYLSAYVATSTADNSVVRYGLVNLVEWSSNKGSGARPVEQFRIPVPKGAKKAVARHLASPHGANAVAEAAEGQTQCCITWAGEQWTFASNGIGKMVGNKYEQLNITGGYVTVSVAASAAAMVDFGY